MNWTCVVWGVPMLMVTLWWFISAHKWFKGPKVNIEHMMLGREEAVVVGEEVVLDRKMSNTSSTEPGLTKIVKTKSAEAREGS